MALQVDQSRATQLAYRHLERLGAAGFTLGPAIELEADEITLAYIYPLEPQGYIVIAADDVLPPVIAYSLQSGYPSSSTENPLKELLQVDLSSRMQYSALMPQTERDKISREWKELAASVPRRDFEQWPPEGSTPTGGWIKTQWTQNAPYNNMCPLDTSNGNHSLAGCPAVAMAQIVNYHECINGTVFINADDYHHSYAGLSYWIDNDYASWGFPSWFELNGYLYTLMQHYKNQNPQTDNDIAALVYACGAAAHQVYSASGSGTFAVAQAAQAYQRFGFTGSELLLDSDPLFYLRIIGDIQNALPVHLAVVNQDWSMGHNVVIDGYNSDEFYHLNFGWGGPYSGWYLLPSQIPYNLNVIEGAIVDISPRAYLINVPETVVFNTFEDCYQGKQIEFINLMQEGLLIESITDDLAIYPPMRIRTSTVVTLPYMLATGQSLFVTVKVDLPTKKTRELMEVELRLVHTYGVKKFHILVNPELSTAVDDEANSPGILELNCYPNPFSNEATITVKIEEAKALEIGVFNLKGQKIRTLGIANAKTGENQITWDGMDSAGKAAPRGLYIIRSGDKKSQKLLKL